MRVRYAMLMRPPYPGALPKDGLIEVDFNEFKLNGWHCWGTAVYGRELTEEEMLHYDMEWMRTEHEGKVDQAVEK